ncbi:MAG: hypothetical protein ABI426_08200, partial [Flavobacterium sp.]
MNTNEDKHIEKLVDHLMKNQTLETPSFDFTSRVMTQVLERQKSQVTTYKPLISKQTGLAVFGITIAVIVYALYRDNAPTNHFVIPFNYNFLPKINVSKAFNFSSITTYSISLMA